jgi:hypothetical protein
MSLEDDAAVFGGNFEGGWQLGLLVARNVHKRTQAGRPSKSEQVRNKVSCAKFAEKAEVSERTVQLFYDAWQLAAEAGHCTSADELLPGEEDPKLAGIDPELWRKYYRLSRRNHGGGSRGVKAHDKLNRAKSAIANITGLEGDAAVMQTEICRLIDRLLASIQPTTESN